MNDWHEWTSCQFYGHDFVDDEDRSGFRVCNDCFERVEK